MQSVQKYRLILTDEQKLTLPQVASIIHAEITKKTDGIDLYVWGDHDGPTTDLTFYVVDTYQDLPDTFSGVHLRTLAKGDGNAYHVFMKPPPRQENIQRGKPVIAERNPNDPGQAHTRKRPTKKRGKKRAAKKKRAKRGGR